MITLLSKEHRITEKGMMEFQPFGRRPDGSSIRELSGVVTRAHVEHLEDVVSRKHGADAGRLAVEQLVRLLNERIPDHAYHVTESFLRNPWHSYSNEFSAFVGEVCVDISGDPDFAFGMAREKAIPSVIQVLGRPFSVPQIYKMSAYFSKLYAETSFVVEAISVSDRSAVLRMVLSEQTYHHFGLYRRRCAYLWCISVKGYFVGVPERFHGLPPAQVTDRHCIAEGDDYCEWTVTWSAKERRVWPVMDWFSGRTRGPASRSRQTPHTPPVLDTRPERQSESDTTTMDPALTRERNSPERSQQGIATILLSNDHRITEKGMMEFQPFGVEPDGTSIRDISGVVIRALVEYLEESVSRMHGQEAGRRAVEELVQRLNERIPDRAFHVTADFLKNLWHSFSNEFGVFLTQFCWDISGDPQFQFNMAREKAISPVIQALGRSFSVPQIYKMSAYFSQRFAKDSFYTEAMQVSNGSAIIRMRFSERALRQFGPYLRACAEMYCRAHKGYFVGVPEKFHNLPPARVTDHTCIAEGDDYCEWEVTWSEEKRRVWPLIGWIGRAIRFMKRQEQTPAHSAPPVVSADRLVGSTSTVATPAGSGAPTVLLSNEHRITEKGMMEFQPFGTEPDGTFIRDLSGVVIRADVEFLEDYVSRREGADAGRRAVEELGQRLNERIPDPAYHVTPRFLRNPWNSYSAEFAAFCAEACITISGEPQFLFHMARQKAISPIIRTLGKPFSVPQIYKMSAYFAQRYAKDSFYTEAVHVSDTSASIQMRFSERTYRQFGPYRRACAEHWCNAHKGYFVGVPEMFHGLPAATVTDRRCTAKGDEYCEWEVAWSAKDRRVWPAIEWGGRRRFGKELEERQQIIEQQAKSLDEWFQELKSAHAQQQQLSAELQRRLTQLTTLHDAGLAFTSTLDRESLINTVLETTVQKLNYDRVMISLYDSTRHATYDARILGVSDEIAEFARSLKVPVTDPNSVEGTVLLRGMPILVPDVQAVWGRLHPLYQQLASMTNTKSILSVPLKAKGRVVGSLTVDRTQPHSLTQDDLDLMVTLANQVAIALDNAEAYRQIEGLNVGLEAKVQERTAALEAANERLQEVDRAKSAFFANINHELRTPLTSTLGALSHLTKANLSQDHQDLVNVALRNNSQLLYLINELLDLARLDAGQGRLNKQCFDLTVLIKDIKSNFEPAIWRRVTLRGTTSPVLVEADPVQLKKVVFNLLSNAFKFSDPDLGQVWIRVKVIGDWVELTVEDNGIGIPREHLDHVFDRFFQVERNETRRYEGSGIGLALVKEIVTLHGGTVSVESEAGQGSTFRIRLPRGNVHPEELGSLEDAQAFLPTMTTAGAAEEKTPASVDAPDAGARPIVLVADDNADLRAYLNRILSKAYRVMLASDGEMALEQARTSRPELILTDVMMPQMSGYDLLREVRKDAHLQTTPVIFLTARAGTEARIESFEAGADDYIAKPFDEHEVLARVGNLIRGRAQERQLHELRMEKLSKFMPAPIARVVLSQGSEELLKAHRREITVLFVDLRDFTRFAELAEPEELMAVLRDYQAEIGSLVSTFQGTLERYSGDAVMIFFNDPVPIPNHVEQAVRMAVAMRTRVGDLCQKWSRNGIDLGVGIGIATGYATLGLVGFQDRHDYAAIGTVTNLAARLCAEAKHQQILVPEQIVHLLEGIVEAEPVGPLQLKGIHRTITAYDIIRLKE